MKNLAKAILILALVMAYALMLPANAQDYGNDISCAQRDTVVVPLKLDTVYIEVTPSMLEFAIQFVSAYEAANKVSQDTITALMGSQIDDETREVMLANNDEQFLQYQAFMLDATYKYFKMLLNPPTDR